MRTRRFDLVSLSAVAAGAVAGHVFLVTPLLERLTFESVDVVACELEPPPLDVVPSGVAGARPGVMPAEPAEHRVAAPFRAHAFPGDRLLGVFEGRARFTPETPPGTAWTSSSPA